MSDHVQQLEAGGLVPVTAKLPADLPADTVDARWYSHPALPDRILVRLAPDALARGVDTEMGLLGFEMTGHHDDVARQRRRSLGFPGTALVDDPDRARFALDVMKEFRKHAKRASSKPGHARDGFDAIAGSLSRQVPAFLPSYWEEVGRTFCAAGNPTYAATAFDRARTAEREFGLNVDEERRGESFLEFALAGALTVKALRSYGKELVGSVGADAAYERMYALAVRRTLGGVPPWASLPADLRALAKAAKRKPLVEDMRFLREVIGGNAVVRAPLSFWEDYRAASIALGQEDPVVRRRLLDLFPSGGGRRRSAGFDEAWMDLLASCSALDAVWDPAVEPPTGGRAAWLARLYEWADRGNGWILQLVRRAAPLLIADGVPILAANWEGLDLDLGDLLVELGIPWAESDGGRRRLQLAVWSTWQPAPARHGFAAEVRPRDPVHAVTDPKMAERIASAVDEVFGDGDFARVASRMTALSEMRRQWLLRQLSDVDAAGLASTGLALARLESATTPSHFAEYPESIGVLAAAGVARPLLRTLQTGILEEWCWPAFEEVLAELAPSGGYRTVFCTVQWPYLILGDKLRVRVLGPNGIECRHDCKTDDNVPSCAAWVGGQLFVAWTSYGPYRHQAYWSSAPTDAFEIEHPYGRHAMAWSGADALLVDTTWVAPGDRRAIPLGRTQVHDRDGSWIETDDGWQPQDRVTGALIAGDPPPFVAGLPSDAVAWFPVPVPTSPLPLSDGQYGARRKTVDGTPVFETVGGERYQGTFREGSQERTPTMLVRWPGASGYRAVYEDSSWRAEYTATFTLADPDRPLAAWIGTGEGRTTGVLPIGRFWHYLVPRDPAGSEVLRNVTTARVEALLAGGRAERAGSAGATLAAVTATFPTLTDDVLRAAVVAAVTSAADYEQRLADLRTGRCGGIAPEAASEDAIYDGAISPALACLGAYARGGRDDVVDGIHSLASFLVKDGETGRRIHWTRVHQHHWIGRIRAIAWCALRPGLTAEQRADLVRMLKVWADSPLADAVWFRAGRMRLDALAPWVTTKLVDGAVVPWEAWRHDQDGRRLLAWGAKQEPEGPWWLDFLECSRDGAFPDWENAEILGERRASTAGDREWLRAFLAAEAVNGDRPMSAALARTLAERTGQSPVEAAFLLATFPPEPDADLRGQLDLKVAELAVVQQAEPRSMEDRLDLLAAAAPADPAQFWSDDVVTLLADAYLAKFGRQVSVAPALVSAAEKELGRGVGARLPVFARYTDRGWPVVDTPRTWDLDVSGRLQPSPPFESGEGSWTPGSLACNVAFTLAWLVGKVPVGDPLLAGARDLHRRLVALVTAPSVLLEAGSWYSEGAQAFFDALGGEPIERVNGDGTPVCTEKRTGGIVARKARSNLALWFRPTDLDPTDLELLTTFARACGSDLRQRAAWEHLQSADFAALVERAVDSPLAPGEWEQDPSKSAPAVVKAMSSELGLSSEAATLYLQTLTLLEPAKKNVCLWNGWSPKTYAAAAEACVAAGLLLHGKRARSGREHFLPGAWIERDDILPYEEWKWPLYGGAPFGRLVPIAPFYTLFERAWERARAEPPRFDPHHRG